MSNLKEEFKTKMKNLNDEYRAIKADLDELEKRENLIKKAIEFQDYKFKASLYYSLSTELIELTSEDIPHIQWNHGCAMLHIGSDNSYLVVKDQADLDWHRKVFEVQALVRDTIDQCPSGRTIQEDNLIKQKAMKKLYEMLK